MTTSPNVVPGAVSSVSELGKDQAWLQGWLREQPARLGLGDLNVVEGDPVQDEDGNPAFLAGDDERCFCVDVRLGELEASHGFGVLHNWARNRVRHPDKNHVAVLVTESAGERYRSTLEALAEHLPLVVVELQVWRGEREAIIVPHVALASGDVDLTSTPAAAAGQAVARAKAVADTATVDAEDATLEEAPDAGSDETPDAGPVTADGKDESDVPDPWGLPKRNAAESEASLDGSLTGVASR